MLLSGTVIIKRNSWDVWISLTVRSHHEVFRIRDVASAARPAEPFFRFFVFDSCWFFFVSSFFVNFGRFFFKLQGQFILNTHSCLKPTFVTTQMDLLCNYTWFSNYLLYNWTRFVHDISSHVCNLWLYIIIHIYIYIYIYIYIHAHLFQYTIIRYVIAYITLANILCTVGYGNWTLTASLVLDFTDISSMFVRLGECFQGKL